MWAGSACRAPTREGLVDNLVIDHLTSLLSACADAGAWSIDDARFTAVFLFSGMLGIVDCAYLKERPGPPGQAATAGLFQNRRIAFW